MYMYIYSFFLLCEGHLTWSFAITLLASHHHHLCPEPTWCCKTQYLWHSHRPALAFYNLTVTMKWWLGVPHATGIAATHPLGAWFISPGTMYSRFMHVILFFHRDLQTHPRTRLGTLLWTALKIWITWTKEGVMRPSLDHGHCARCSVGLSLHKL